jgi:hypothetical protein
MGMETLKSLAQWFFLDSIYGGILVVAAVYSVAKFVKFRHASSPNPEVLAGVVLVLCFLILPAIPRYYFERQTLDELDGKNWIRITNETYAGAIWLPVTWVKTPLYSITAVMPELIEADSYQLIRLTFDKEPYVASVTAWCEDSNIWFAEPDKAGTLRYTERRSMRQAERQLYCESDWGEQRDALYAEFKRQKP